MFNDGAVKEVKNFISKKVPSNFTISKLIGINEIKDYLDSNIGKQQAKELIKIRTRQYTKRQFTWARGHMKSWEMIYSPNFNDLFKQAINKIS